MFLDEPEIVPLVVDLPKIRVAGWKTHASQFQKFSIRCGGPCSCNIVLRTEGY